MSQEIFDFFQNKKKILNERIFRKIIKSLWDLNFYKNSLIEKL